jgi:hypothetical protein
MLPSRRLEGESSTKEIDYIFYMVILLRRDLVNTFSTGKKEAAVSRVKGLRAAATFFRQLDLFPSGPAHICTCLSLMVHHL